ncbi:uncharacterized protein LOC131950109 [Physella acuta]|uniref:uncharacterized protein LOC131950109 n=1 Tax=Physella acuta TaxID=109671 RepID=UPI0027DCB19A|nr:uncharacterized protein LOC131950109 [Physella acuta]
MGWLQFWGYCVNINLDEYDQQYSNTKCKNSLIVNQDYFLMSGSVDFSDAGSAWDETVNVQTRKYPTNDFKQICPISTSATENNVKPDSCYCNNCSGDIKHFTINRTAEFQYSKAEIKVLIQSSNGEDNEYSMKKLPEMISLDQTTSTLIADDKILTHEDCGSNSTLIASKIRLCCHSGNEPCTSVIYKNGVKSNDSSCADVELTSSEIANLTFELEICGEVLKTAIQSCKIKGKTAENNELTNTSKWIIVAGVLVAAVGLITMLIIFIVKKMNITCCKGNIITKCLDFFRRCKNTGQYVIKPEVKDNPGEITYTSVILRNCSTDQSQPNETNQPPEVDQNKHQDAEIKKVKNSSKRLSDSTPQQQHANGKRFSDPSPHKKKNHPTEVDKIKHKMCKFKEK